MDKGNRKMILSAPTLLCGVITSGVALGMCIVDWVGSSTRQPTNPQQPTDRHQLRQAVFQLESDALQFDMEMTLRMRQAGLKCSVVNGKVVHDRDLPASKQCTCGSGSCERHSCMHPAYNRQSVPE